MNCWTVRQYTSNEHHVMRFRPITLRDFWLVCVNVNCFELFDCQNSAHCGGLFRVASEKLIVKSPGYDSPGYYQNHIQCNWLIQVTIAVANNCTKIISEMNY